MGQFSIDLDVALRKLRQHQVANQHHYLHRLIRAAVILDSPRADIVCRHDKIRVSFPKAVCPPDQLDTILRSVLDHNSPEVRELATSLNLAIGLEPTSLEVKISNGETSRVLQVQGGEAEIYSGGPAPTGTTFQMTRPGTMFAKMTSEAPEYFHIFRNFRYCPVDLFLNTRQIPAGHGWGQKSGNRTFRFQFPFRLVSNFLGQHIIEVRFRDQDRQNNTLRLSPSQARVEVLLESPRATGGGQQELGDSDHRFQMAIGLTGEDSVASTASFILHGETLQVFPVAFPIPGVELLVSAHGLDLDISGEKLVENEKFEERWRRAKQTYLDLEQSLRQAYPGTSPKKLVRRALFDQQSRWRPHLEALHGGRRNDNSSG